MLATGVPNRPGAMDIEHQDNDGYRRFREAMQKGQLQAGMTVTQNELCDLLGLSLSPLRETLVLLEEFGLVEIKPRAGIRIVFPEVGFIRENMQFRTMIETHALRTFVDNVTGQWLAEMRELHAEVRGELTGTTDFEVAKAHFIAVDYQFHRDIVAALNNRTIQVTHQRVWENLGMAKRVHQRAAYRAQLVETIDEHVRVIDCLAQHDAAGAVSSLEAHFRGATHRAFAA
jgi:GntR family transcriptional regulator, rspAB operon transcriptional repressor